MSFVIAILSGILFSEVVGYAIHWLIHSGKIQWMQRAHMRHHLEFYPPKSIMRDFEYRGPKHTVGIGWEWVIPTFLVSLILTGILLLAGLSYLLITVVQVTAIIWGLVMFNLLHSSFHIREHWLSEAKTPIRVWYKKIRRSHDVHHHWTDEKGRMMVNFGISQFWLDRLFGTFRQNLYDSENS